MKTDKNRPYWNMEIESKLNTPEMLRIQEFKLKKRVKLLRQKSPYYKQLFKTCGVHEDKLLSFEEFRNAVPLFTKKDWRGLVEKYEGHLLETLNHFLPVNAYEDLYLMCATTGTTGEPQPYPMTKEDLWNVWGEIQARWYWRFGMRSTDRVLLAYGLSMFLAGIPSIVGCWKIGAMVIPVGAEAGTQRILQMAKYFHPTVLMGTPSLATYLIEKAPETIGMEVGQLGIRAIACGGEPGAGVPQLRQKIESAYGALLFDMAGGAGVSCNQKEYQGMHQVAEDLVIMELVDPDTKKLLPFENGQKGEAVFTAIDGHAFGGVRSSMGDIMEIYTDPCPCGLSGFRYKIIGRSDDMLKVKGVIVYPASIRGVLESFVSRITGQFRIILDEPLPKVTPPLKLKIEHGEGFPQEKLEELANEIGDVMHSKIKIRPQIIWVGPNDLERSTFKGKTFEKTYENKG